MARYYTAPSANPDVGNYVVFLHGGGYMNEIVRAHWRLVGYRPAMLAFVASFPFIRSLPAPPRRTSCRNRRPVAEASGQAGPAKVTVVGNSAGAGFGLAAAQWLATPDTGNRTGWC